MTIASKSMRRPSTSRLKRMYTFDRYCSLPFLADRYIICTFCIFTSWPKESKIRNACDPKGSLVPVIPSPSGPGVKLRAATFICVEDLIRGGPATARAHFTNGSCQTPSFPVQQRASASLKPGVNAFERTDEQKAAFKKPFRTGEGQICGRPTPFDAAARKSIALAASAFMIGCNAE